MSSATTIVIVCDGKFEPDILDRINTWLRENSHHSPNLRLLNDLIPGSKGCTAWLYAATINALQSGLEEFLRKTCDGYEMVVSFCQEGETGVEVFQIPQHYTQGT